MFCPSCGSEERQASQFCRACGTDLRGVRVGLERPDAVTASAVTAREEIGRAVAERIREMEDARYMRRFAQYVLPKVDKFLESPEEKRLRRLRSGTITALIGIAIGVPAIAFTGYVNDQDLEIFLAYVIGFGSITLAIGLGLLFNGLFFSKPRKKVEDRSSQAHFQNVLDAGYTPPISRPDAASLRSPTTFEPRSVSRRVGNRTDHPAFEGLIPRTKMAVNFDGRCRVSEMGDGAPLIEGTLRIWNQIGRATGAQTISLSVMEFAPGLSPTIQNHDCDQILYVVDYDCAAVADGSQRRARSATPLDQHPASSSHPKAVQRTGEAGSIDINGSRFDIASDTGIYLRPNQTFAIDNPTPDAIIIISSQCPDPARDPIFINAPTTPDNRAETDLAPIVRLIDQKAQPTADRWYRVLVDDEIGSEQVTQFVGSIPPGRAPDHFHHYEEVLFILKGEGRMWAGDSNTRVTTGSCIYLPKGQVHCVENTGIGELRLLGIFYPAGSPSVRYDA